jgi:hypothetical protein
MRRPSTSSGRRFAFGKPNRLTMTLWRAMILERYAPYQRSWGQICGKGAMGSVQM